MKKYILISSLVLATALSSFATDNSGDPEFRGSRVSPPSKRLSAIPEDETVRAFDTSIGPLVITKENGGHYRIALSLPGRRVGGLDNFYWNPSGANSALSIRATMTDKEIKEAIEKAGLTAQQD